MSIAESVSFVRRSPSAIPSRAAAYFGPRAALGNLAALIEYNDTVFQVLSGRPFALVLTLAPADEHEL